MNVLKPELLIAIQTLLKRGATQREIERVTGVDRKTIRRYQRLANSSGVATGVEPASEQIPPPRPPATATPSACEPHRAWIEAQVGLGRNAVSIYAKVFGVTQPRVSDLMRGKINLFGLDALVNMATAAGLHIDLRIVESA